MIPISYNDFKNRSDVVCNCVIVSVFRNFTESYYIGKKVFKTLAVSSPFSSKVLFSVNKILSESNGFNVFQKV